MAAKKRLPLRRNCTHHGSGKNPAADTTPVPWSTERIPCSAGRSPRSPAAFSSSVIPTGAGRLFLRTVSVRSLRGGVTLATLQPHKHHRDPTNNQALPIFLKLASYLKL